MKNVVAYHILDRKNVVIHHIFDTNRTVWSRTASKICRIGRRA